MRPRITAVKYLDNYRLQLTFTTGEQGVIDLADRVIGRGGMFVPLQDVRYFAKVQVEPDFGTIVWPNDLDLDPDVLYERTIKPLQDWHLTLAEETDKQAHPPIQP